MTMQIRSTLTGIHSRSEESVRISRDYDRGRADEHALRQTFERDAKALVDLEIKSGFTNLSDGQLKWQDFIRPFSESLAGLKSGADLSRWFDTNTFYRKPAVTGRIRTKDKESFIVQKYAENSAFSGAEVTKQKKLSLPGPYTLARLVD